MPTLSSKSRAHRARVLQNQAKTAAEAVAADCGRPDSQLKIPLLVEVRRGAAAKPRARRTRLRAAADQPDLGEL